MSGSGPLHLGEAGYQKFLADLEDEKLGGPARLVMESSPAHKKKEPQGRLFE